MLETHPMDDRHTMKRTGFTLIEMLVSLAITLIMMAAVVTLFKVVSDSVSQARTGIEMADRLRAARDMIQLDIDHMTAPLAPPLRPETDSGYFEYIEGEHFDGDSSGLTVDLFGDTDDALLFTASNASQPFLGKFNGQILESTNAEVVYFLKQDGPVIDAIAVPPVKLFTLYRRVMLISPSAGQPGFSTDITDTFYETFDVSARVDTAAAHRVLNTMGDLTKPENRFGRVAGAGAGGFPHRFPVDTDPANPPLAFANARLGDDVLLTNVLAFDVQLFDTGAPLFFVNDVTMEPGDIGYAAALGGTPVAFGAYVDLGYATTYTPSAGDPLPLFNQQPTAKSGSTARPFAFDTWSLHYENDGLDQDTTNGADASTNGLDDNGNGLVDEVDERDTLPPYASKARGIRISLRVYELNSKQVREAVIVGGM